MFKEFKLLFFRSFAYICPSLTTQIVQSSAHKIHLWSEKIFYTLNVATFLLFSSNNNRIFLQIASFCSLRTWMLQNSAPQVKIFCVVKLRLKTIFLYDFNCWFRFLVSFLLFSQALPLKFRNTKKKIIIWTIKFAAYYVVLIYLFLWLPTSYKVPPLKFIYFKMPIFAKLHFCFIEASLL